MLNRLRSPGTNHKVAVDGSHHKRGRFAEFPIARQCVIA
jgi:hypothetical protein